MPPYLITNTRLFNGDSVISISTNILVQNGQIAQISETKPSTLPPGTMTIDGSGKTLIPGLIDAHVHSFREESFLKRAIKHGVTTVLDMQNEPAFFHYLKRIADECNDVADVRSACHAATVKDGWPATFLKVTAKDDSTDEMIGNWPDLTKPDAAEEYVTATINSGASYIKIFLESGEGFDMPFPVRPLPTPTAEVQRAVVQAAHKYNKVTIAHAVDLKSTKQALDVGVDGLSHSCAEPIDQDCIDSFEKNNAFVISTLVVHASGSGEEQESRERFSRNLPKDEKEKLTSGLNFTHPPILMKNGCEIIRQLKDAGVDIVCGTDSSPPFPGLLSGVSLHHELWLYVKRCGLTPLEALRSATGVTSRRMKMPDRGMIKEGLPADLVLVNGDPTSDIEALDEIVGVWRNGQKLDESS